MAPRPSAAANLGSWNRGRRRAWLPVKSSIAMTKKRRSGPVPCAILEVPRFGSDLGGVITQFTDDMSDATNWELKESTAVPGALEAIARIVRKFGRQNVFIISRVGPVMRAKSETWLHRTVDICRKTGLLRQNIRFCKDVTGARGKGVIAASLGLSHFIDDKDGALESVYSDPHGNAREAIERHDGQLYHFPRSGLGGGPPSAARWPQARRPACVRPVSGWSDVLRHLQLTEPLPSIKPSASPDGAGATVSPAGGATAHALDGAGTAGCSSAGSADPPVVGRPSLRPRGGDASAAACATAPAGAPAGADLPGKPSRQRLRSPEGPPPRHLQSPVGSPGMAAASEGCYVIEARAAAEEHPRARPTRASQLPCAETADAKLATWLTWLDGGRGRYERYFQPLRDLGGLATMQLLVTAEPSNAGVIGQVDPSLWAAIDVEPQHKWALAKGLVELCQ